MCFSAVLLAALVALGCGDGAVDVTSEKDSGAPPMGAGGGDAGSTMPMGSGGQGGGTSASTGTGGGDAGSPPKPGMTPMQAAAEFAKDAVNWLTTYEDATDQVALGGSQGAASVALRNGMRNAVRWYDGDASHRLDGPTNLGMCMTAYALKEAYPYLPAAQLNITKNLMYLQRALLATEQQSAAHMAQYAFPAGPGATQYSAKTNAVCGLAFLELYAFWNALGETAYRDDAKAAALHVKTFLARLQNPVALPTMPASLALVSPKDENGDGRYDGIFEEIDGDKLVMASATWGAMAGRFFAKLGSVGFAGVNAAEMSERAQGMKTFISAGLGAGAEHYSPRFTCSGAACADQLIASGSSIAVVAKFTKGASSVSGGDDAWHARISRHPGDTVLFDNLNGTDPVQWALDALYGIDPGWKLNSHISKYFSQNAKQVHKTDKYYVISLADRRDIFLGLGTYIAHGHESGGVFTLAADSTDVAHYVEKNGIWQIVTSNYGDNAVSNWSNAAWSSATETLLTPYDLTNPKAAVYLQGAYDFGKLSHLAHWAMTYEQTNAAVVLQPKLGSPDPNHQQMRPWAVSSENMASTLCRVLRYWKGTAACTM